MQIIPVIDLKDGCVVSAHLGNRADYQPISSHLCPSSSIDDVLGAFLKLYSFKTVYIADLNAICHTGSHQKMIEKISNKHKDIEFWIDNGMKLIKFKQTANFNNKVVIGSESQQSVTTIPKSNFILSLDFKQDKPLGNIGLFENNQLWPANIIIMTLTRVGSQAGPDFKRLEQYYRKYPKHNFIAAGGIRHIDDLNALKTIGIKQALLSSSLHSGKITGRDIKNLQAKKYPG